MKCNGCGFDKAAVIRIGYTDGVRWEICDKCSSLKTAAMPDIYFGNQSGIQTDENLCGSDGNPIPFSSKREKATIMKHLGLRQADCAERHHGSRNESHLNVGKTKYFI